MKRILIVIACAVLCGCGQPATTIKHVDVDGIAAATFDSGAIAMMSAIRENPNVATMDGASQLSAAKQWWLKHSAVPYPLKEKAEK